MDQKRINELNLLRCGKLLNNYCIAFGMLMLYGALILNLGILYYLVCTVILIYASLIMVFSMFKANIDIEYLASAMFDNSEDILLRIFDIAKAATPYLFVLTVIAAAASIIIFVRDKNDKHITRIVLAALSVVAGIVALSVHYGLN